jgi:hypothetical protein
MPGAVDPTGKLKFWVWEVSEMTVSDFRLCDFPVEGQQPALLRYHLTTGNKNQLPQNITYVILHA